MSASTVPTSDLDLSEIEAFANSTPPYPGMSLAELIAYRETDEAKALVGWIKEKFTKAKSLRSKAERQWNLNLAFYNGNQWAQFYVHGGEGVAGRLGVPVSARNKERKTINRIEPVVRTDIAKFTSQKPGASVIAATDEDEDIMAAVAAQQVWEATSHRRNLSDEQADAIYWMCITGNGFIKTVWDASLKDADTSINSDEPVLGDVRYASIDPYKIFVPDIKEKSLQEQMWIFHAYAKSMEWLALRFKEAIGDKNLNPSCSEAGSIEEESFARAHTKDEKNFDSCMVYEFWVKPGNCKHLPQGGMVTMIDDLIVEIHNEGMPYEHGEYPFAHFGYIKQEGFYYRSPIQSLIESQRDYNSLRSQIAEARKKMGKPQLTAQKGAVTASKITNEIGVLIEYKAGMQPPQPLALQNIPQYMLTENEWILRDIEDISGQHEVSKGQTPAGVTAATAIAYLQESDDSFRLPAFKNVESAYGTIARQTLQLFVEFVDTPRLIKIVGKDDTFSTELLTGSDIKRGTDIRVEPGSSLPDSKAARQAFIMDLMTNGFVDPNEGLDMLQIGGTQKLIDTIKNDKRQAQRENIKFKRLTEQDLESYRQAWTEGMAQLGMTPDAGGMLTDPQGQPMLPPLIIPVNDWDKHDVHIEEHNRFRRTQEFEVLPPEIKELLQSHVKMHEMMAMGAMPQEPGAPGAPDAPSAPSEQGAVDLAQSGGSVPPEEPSATPEMTQMQGQGELPLGE